MSFGKLHFGANDVGDSTSFRANIRQAHCAPDVRESKKRVLLLHLALGVEWGGQGFAKRVPCKALVMHLAAQIRTGGYKQSQSYLAVIQNPKTHRSYELRERTHDVMMPGRDRNFRNMNWLMISNLKLPVGAAIRVFDVVTIGTAYHVNVYEFGHGASPLTLGRFISLLEWNRHMRFHKPSPATAPTFRRDWRNRFNNAARRPNSDWRETIGNGDTLVCQPNLLPCKGCLRLGGCKIILI